MAEGEPEPEPEAEAEAESPKTSVAKAEPEAAAAAAAEAAPWQRRMWPRPSRRLSRRPWPWPKRLETSARDCCKSVSTHTSIMLHKKENTRISLLLDAVVPSAPSVLVHAEQAMVACISIR